MSNESDQIYNYDPSLPISSSNPIINSINPPDSSFYYGLGGYLAVGRNINSATPAYTFYIKSGINGLNNSYTYYNGTNWVITGDTLASGRGIEEGSNLIYEIRHFSMDDKIYKYTGSGSASLVLSIPHAYGEGLAGDVEVDCADNFYVLKLKYNNSLPYFRKYNSSGTLLRSWILSNDIPVDRLNTQTFAIIDSFLYFSRYGISLTPDSIVKCSIGATALSLKSIQALPFTETIGDFATFSQSSLLPAISISSIPNVYCANTQTIFTASTIDAGANPTYHWYKNNVLVGTNTTYIYSTPVVGDSIWCMLTSDDPCGAANNITIKSNVVKITEILTPPHPPISRTLTNDTLFTNTYLAYQWYFKGSPIVNATAINYHFTQNGWYKVQVYDNHGCPGFSDSMHITNVSISSVYYQNGAVQIFPNPTHSTFQLSTKEPLTIQLYNTLGQMVLTASLNSGASGASGASASSATAATAAATSVTEPAEVNIAQLPTGLYLIKEAKTGLIIGKVMKE